METRTDTPFVMVSLSQARLLAGAMAAQQTAALRVQAIVDTLTAGHEELHGLPLTAVDTDTGRLLFGAPPGEVSGAG
jgi:hypothetical protein